jgi:ABC-type antimicrobial peptide transport system permease subunit
MDKEDLTARVERNKADLAVAEARIEDVQARLKLAQVQLQRHKQLIVSRATSQDALDIAAKELTVNQAALRLAQRQVESARAAVNESRANLAYATLTAPISGIIASVSTQEGETVTAGLNAPVFVTIIDLTRLQVDAFVDEVDIGKVRIDQKAVFTVDSFPAKEFEGKVVAIYHKAVIQENVVNYDTVIDIASPFEGLLKPDMTASRLLNQDYISYIRVKVKDTKDLVAIGDEIRKILHERHHITPPQEDDFAIVTASDIAKAARGISGTLSILLIALAALSLIVGGIVLMNILLISVSERVKEIGLRRALGATQSDIFMQFLAESLAITLLGMLFGCLVGWGASLLVGMYAKAPVIISWEPFALAVVFSLMVGLFFGIQPARRAARLKPVEALQ